MTSRRRAFTLVEVSLGFAIAAVVLIVVFEVFLAGRKSVRQISESHRANETVMATFRALAKDIRSARDIFSPELLAPGTAVPDFDFQDADTGTHVLELEVGELRVVNGNMTTLAKRVRWYLDEAEEIPGGGGKRLFKLFRRESPQAVVVPPAPGQAAAAPPPFEDPVEMAAGVTELVFYRAGEPPQTATAGEGSPPVVSLDGGAENVRVLMRSARVRRKPDGSTDFGYGADLRTTIHRRGKKP